MWMTQPFKVIFMTMLVVTACSLFNGCDKTTITGEGANIPMKTYFIGRFSVELPSEMKQEERSSELAYTKIEDSWKR
jgi:hypothetical protein